MKVQRSADLKFVALLWPTAGWPPEIDFAEDAGGSRRRVSAFLHHGPDNRQIARSLRRTNLTRWHEVGVRWTPGRLEYLIDGRVWAKVTGAEVPSQPMWLAVQTEALRSARKSGRRHTDLLIDRVRVWSWQSAA
jgi:beta-glucanase (GH16 family)